MHGGHGMDIDMQSLIADLEALERKPSDLDPAKEADHLQRLCSDPSVAGRLEPYGRARGIGAGGAGIVLAAAHEPTSSERALKFPRYRLYRSHDHPHVGAELSETREAPVEVDPELSALQKVSHQNITRLYEAFRLPNARSHCMITEYVTDKQSLDEYARTVCCSVACRNNPFSLGEALRTLAKAIHQVADALHYMHSVAGLLHSDVKPDNILVSGAGIPYVTDLGFARDLHKYGPDDALEMGFTWRYAHPRLTDPYLGARVSKVPEKAKIPVTGKDLKPILDVFAFGRTLQELLGVLDAEYGEHVHSQYAFGYLHLVACLCLDGKNGAHRDSSPRGSFISDSFMGMPLTFFSLSKFSGFEEVLVALQRLLGQKRLEDELPEIDRWYGSTIKVSDVGGATTLTPRVENVINHPCFQRLKKVNQLGLLDSVFPTATHNRFQHSLGTYHAATQYVAALYYDPDNPVFRVLADSRRCAVLLVAALVHDLGNTSLGHELEEVDEKEFDHKEYVYDILISKSFLDLERRTLGDIIGAKGDGTWGIEIGDVLSMVHKKGSLKTPFDGVLRDILDSQIDADKLDYLIRDSVECRVNYGHGIDYDRFLRSLTTHVGEDGVVRLAIKQKGSASAEAFALARYQLYQSLYWHHTFRSTKAMLLEAVRLIVEDLRKRSGPPDMLGEYELRTAYVREVIEVRKCDVGERKPRRRSGSRKSGRKPVLRELLVDILRKESEPMPGPYENDDALRFFWRLSDGASRKLLHDLAVRRYYKRLIEISPGELTLPAWQALRDQFKSVEQRGALQAAVQEALMNSLRSEVQSKSIERISLVRERTMEKINSLAADRVLFLLDIPLRGWYASNEFPVYVSDYKRRHFRAEAENSGYEGREDFWIKGLGDMMKEIAFIRVFCEPEIHSIATRIMSAKTILRAVKQAIPALSVVRG